MNISPSYPTSRLTDDTYTVDEVGDALDDAASVVNDDVESELLNAAHTNVLLLQQVFAQAQKWHLNLDANLAELENRSCRLSLTFIMSTPPFSRDPRRPREFSHRFERVPELYYYESAGSKGSCASPSVQFSFWTLKEQCRVEIAFKISNEVVH